MRFLKAPNSFNAGSDDLGVSRELSREQLRAASRAGEHASFGKLPEGEEYTPQFVRLLQANKAKDKERSEMVFKMTDENFYQARTGFMQEVAGYLRQLNLRKQKATPVIRLPGYGTLKLPSVLGAPARTLKTGSRINMEVPVSGLKNGQKMRSKSELSEQIKETLATAAVELPEPKKKVVVRRVTIKDRTNPLLHLKPEDLERKDTLAWEGNLEDMMKSKLKKSRTTEKPDAFKGKIETNWGKKVEKYSQNAVGQLEPDTPLPLRVRINRNFGDFRHPRVKKGSQRGSPGNAGTPRSILILSPDLDMSSVPPKTHTVVNTSINLSERGRGCGNHPATLLLTVDPNFLSSYYAMAQKSEKEIVSSQPNIFVKRVEKQKSKGNPTSLERLPPSKPKSKVEDIFAKEGRSLETRKSIWMNIIDSLLDNNVPLTQKPVWYYRLFLITGASRLKQVIPLTPTEDLVRRIYKDLEYDINFDFSFRPVHVNEVFYC